MRTSQTDLMTKERCTKAATTLGIVNPKLFRILCRMLTPLSINLYKQKGLHMTTKRIPKIITNPIKFRCPNHQRREVNMYVHTFSFSSFRSRRLNGLSPTTMSSSSSSSAPSTWSPPPLIPLWAASSFSLQNYT